jgi:hypothetical protein
MLKSDTHKFIFIHVYKTAGSSLRKSLIKYDDYDRYGIKREVNRVFNLFGRTLFPAAPANKHLSATEIMEIVGENVWQRYFTFGVVRNPYDWQVSMYKYAQQTRRNHHHRKFLDMTFDDYIQWRCDGNVRLQKEFIIVKNGVQLDYVARLENLGELKDIFAKKVNIYLDIPHVNRSRRSHFSEYYTDKTLELVYSNFREDFDFFGYDPNPKKIMEVKADPS